MHFSFTNAKLTGVTLLTRLCITIVTITFMTPMLLFSPLAAKTISSKQAVAKLTKHIEKKARSYKLNKKEKNNIIRQAKSFVSQESDNRQISTKAIAAIKKEINNFIALELTNKKTRKKKAKAKSKSKKAKSKKERQKKRKPEKPGISLKSARMQVEDMIVRRGVAQENRKKVLKQIMHKIGKHKHDGKVQKSLVQKIAEKNLKKIKHTERKKIKSLKFARAKIRRMMTRHKIPESDRVMLSEKIMKRIMEHGARARTRLDLQGVDRNVVRTIALEVIHQYEQEYEHHFFTLRHHRKHVHGHHLHARPRRHRGWHRGHRGRRSRRGRRGRRGRGRRR